MLEKKLTSRFLSGKAALKFCLASICLPSFSLVGRQLAWALAQWASENEKLLAQQENLFVLDNQRAFFPSPVVGDLQL